MSKQCTCTTCKDDAELGGGSLKASNPFLPHPILQWGSVSFAGGGWGTHNPSVITWITYILANYIPNRWNLLLQVVWRPSAQRALKGTGQTHEGKTSIAAYDDRYLEPAGSETVCWGREKTKKRAVAIMLFWQASLKICGTGSETGRWTVMAWFFRALLCGQ